VLKSQLLSIKTVLFAIAMIVALPCVGIIIHSGLQLRNNAIENAGKETQKIVERIVSEQQNQTAATEQLMATLARLPDVVNQDAGKVQTILNSLLQLNPQFVNIVIADAGGNVWCSGIPTKLPISIADRRHFRNALSSGHLSSSEYLIGRTTNQPSLSYAYPYRNQQGKIAGVIVVAFNLDYYKKVTEQFKLPPSAGLLLIDHKGTIIFASKITSLKSGTPLRKDLYQHMVDGPEEYTGIIRSMNGDERIISYRKLRLNDESAPYLYVRMGIPFNEALSAANTMLINNVALLSSFLLMAVVAAYMVSKYFIVKRISLLVDASRCLANGDRQIQVAGFVTGGELGALAQSFDHMTEQIERRERALRESEAKLKEAQRVANIGNWEWNATTDTTFWSEELYRLLNFDPNLPAPTYKQHLKQYTLESTEKLDAAVKRALQDGEPYELDLELAHPVVTTRGWIVARGEVFRNEDGGIIGLRGTAQDITDRKIAEEEKLALERQLHQAQKMESVGQLAGGVAHDFNNMLGVILGRAEMARMKSEPSQPIFADLTEIQKAAERSADLTRQLLAFARKQTIAPKVLDLNETLVGMFKMLQRLIGEDIHINWKSEADLWPVKVDPSQIDQILANLCINARDAVAGNGNIMIETGNSVIDENYCAHLTGFIPGDYVRLAVSDDGCGMDKETLAHIFEPFFTTKGIGEGTGLGLATVYGVVKQNNGFIYAYSEPGSGTTFTIYLPRHVGKAEHVQKEGAEQAPLRGQETILLVEDEPSILKMTTMMLEGLGYTVLAASTPGEAICQVREHASEIHLLMTDVIMPEMNGQDLAQKLHSLYPHIKRLFMSGYTADVIALNGKLDEGVYFIQKPFSIHGMAATVRKVLDSK